MTLLDQFNQANAACPVVAILRGLTPDKACAVVEQLYESGIRIVEVPLNSPQPYDSIARIAQQFGQDMIVGAGTVTQIPQVQQVIDAGGQIIVSPNCNTGVIEATIEQGALPLPGVATPTEAFAAIDAGAQLLKLFPAGVLGTAWIKAIGAVLPKHVRVYAVGGVNPSNMADYLNAGFAGAGIGSDLFKAEYTITEVRQRADAIVAALSDSQ